ncbi:hypothetical protein ACLOJK_038681 [Asimina triloba]
MTSPSFLVESACDDDTERSSKAGVFFSGSPAALEIRSFLSQFPLESIEAAHLTLGTNPEERREVEKKKRILGATETLQDLIEEAKVRTLCWAICVFAITYFLSHTSKSMWTNIPMSILILSALRLVSYKVEFHWKVRPVRQQSYLSHLERRQLSPDDPCLSTPATAPKWKRKIDSPLVEAAIHDFIKKILQEFMVDLWYSAITPDKEAPELIHILITDVLGEVSGRIKAINLVDLLTRDMVDLIGDHIDLYRRNQSSIGADVMGMLSSDERDERLRYHLTASKELHPALLSPESEYKVLQRLVAGVLAVVLRPHEARCPLVRCFARELLTCLTKGAKRLLVISQRTPLFMKGAKRQAMISQLIQLFIILLQKVLLVVPNLNFRDVAFNQSCDMALGKITNHGESFGISDYGHVGTFQSDSAHNMPPGRADWARGLDAARLRRTQVLAPENLENMWTKGRNYTKKIDNYAAVGTKIPIKKLSESSSSDIHGRNTGTDNLTERQRSSMGIEDRCAVQVMHEASHSQVSGEVPIKPQSSQEFNEGPPLAGVHLSNKHEEHTSQTTKGNMKPIRRSSSTSALKTPPDNITFTGGTSEHLVLQKEDEPLGSNVSDLLLHGDGSLYIPKLKCRVVGAYFEKIGSKSFAVYSIAVRDAEDKTWFVKRRYRNFERLHRYLKDIPNYTLHLPPKRFLSSSIDDSFVHQRCILLDKYLQDLLSIANVAEQHEVWDFLSVSSKIEAPSAVDENACQDHVVSLEVERYVLVGSLRRIHSLRENELEYTRGFAINVDDAMDDIVRQFKGVSGGILRKVSGSSPHMTSPSITERHLALSWNEDEINKYSPSHSNMETSHSLSDEEGVKDGAHDEVDSSTLHNGWHSDNELRSKSFPPRVAKHVDKSKDLISERSQQSGMKIESSHSDGYLAMDAPSVSGLVDSVGVPPEWAPPNVSVPLLNLVDKIFQLNRRGWIRLEAPLLFVFSLHAMDVVLQKACHSSVGHDSVTTKLVMEDAIEDWLLRQIQWLRTDDVIARGIRWVQDVLWPNGTFFTKLENRQDEVDSDQLDQRSTQTSIMLGGAKVCRPMSFEMQLEATRRASDVKKMLLGEM